MGAFTIMMWLAGSAGSSTVPGPAVPAVVPAGPDAEAGAETVKAGLPRSGSGLRWWVVGGGAAAAGAAVLVGAVAAVVVGWGELTFADPRAPTASRRTARTMAMGGWGVWAAANALALGGGVAAVWGVTLE